MEQHRRQQVLQVLEQIAPYVRGDGGDITLADIDPDGTVTIRLSGNCVGCGSADYTIHDVVESVMTAQIPWVTGVREAGENETAGYRPTAASATAALEGDHAVTEKLMAALEDAVLSTCASAPPPAAAAEWLAHAHARVIPHFVLEEACVFPAAEVFLDSAAVPLASLRSDHDRFRDLLAAFDVALSAYDRDRTGAALAVLIDATRAMIRQLGDHFLREEGGLFSMLDESLPDDLKRELLSDIRQFQNRRLTPYVH